MGVSTGGYQRVHTYIMHDHATSSGSAARRGRPDSGADGGLIVVSNRQPYRHTYDEDGELEVDRPAGGLTAGLDPAIQEVGGTWIAWGDGDGDREAVDHDDSVRVPPDDPSYTLRRVWLDEEQVADYYYGFANQVLWPLCHSALATVSCEPSFLRRYREVNERFAEVVADRHTTGSPIWLHDYHFALAPQMIRERLGEEPAILHFWHVPWPSWETFRAAPNAEAILHGLLGNDVLGFHVRRYLRNFMACVDAALPGATVDWESDRIHHRGGVTRLTAVPMGVRSDDIQRRATSPEAEAFPGTFRSEHGIDGDVRLAVGVDRLDYTKGIPERLRALERFFERFPAWRGELTYVQSASESRSAIPAYERLQDDVDEAVERVNDRFGTDEWRPVVYTTEWLSQEELAGLYRHADLALVSPIRDGMNLVAQEYVAAQVDADGALLLSEEAGAHEVLGDFALSVDPHDADGFADVIRSALTMSPEERRRRMDGLRRRVAEIDLSRWTDTFLRQAEALAATPAPARTA